MLDIINSVTLSLLERTIFLSKRGNSEIIPLTQIL